MIWVVNAQKFKDNLHLYSVVKSKLRSLDRDIGNTVLNEESDFDQQIFILEREIDRHERVLKYQLEKVVNLNAVLDRLRGFAMNIEGTVTNLLEAWSAGFIVDTLLSETAKNLDAFKKNMAEINQQSANLNSKRTQLLNARNKIEGKQSIIFDGQPMKIIEYDDLNISTYKKAVFIDRNSLNTLFHKHHRIKNEIEFIGMRHRANAFIIAIDPTNAINTLTNDISAIDAELVVRKVHEINLTRELHFEFEREINRLSAELAQEIQKGDEDSSIETQDLNQLRYKKEMLVLKKEQRLIALAREQGQEREAKRGEIMKANKGLYYLDWKHERTTWQHASQTIYFDIGESYLLRRLTTNEVLKVSLEDFLAEARRHPFFG